MQFFSNLSYTKHFQNIWEKLQREEDEKYFILYELLMNSSEDEQKALIEQIKESNPGYYTKYLLWEKDHLNWEKENGIS